MTHTPTPHSRQDGTPRLVYCAGPWAFFTTRPDWQNQWGDDWNDEPYEHNAGEPYTWHDYMSERGVPPYEIVKVAWDGADLDLPREDWLNSPYSVESINKGAVAWLRSPEYRRTAGVAVDIAAGTTLREFIAAINGDGGTVYMAIEGQQPAAGAADLGNATLTGSASKRSDDPAHSQPATSAPSERGL